MEIRRRIGLDRSYLHVMNRGARKVSIFADEGDRRMFRSLLGRFASNYSVNILAWCLMPNHYHIESDSEGTPLSRMMHDLDGTYARAFNRRHDTTGCLFQGPFKSMLIRDEEGLAYVNRYIHLNPIDLGQAPGSYPWSSCAAYLGVAEIPPWMDLEPVSAWLRTSGQSDGESYLEYLKRGLLKPRKKRTHADPVGDFHTEWIRHLEERLVEAMTGRDDVLSGTSLSTIVTWMAQRTYGIPAKVVADFYGYASAATVRAVSGRVQKRLIEDPNFRIALESVTEIATHKR